MKQYEIYLFQLYFLFDKIKKYFSKSNLIEKYRPQNIKDIIGHENIIKQINTFLETNSLPHLLLTGNPGTGKTTLIHAIARQLYGQGWKNYCIEINASDENGIDVVRNKINNFVRSKGLFASKTQQKVNFKLVILDECDQMSAVAQGALRRIIEINSATCRFCLICNYKEKIIAPIISRCCVFKFKPLKQQVINRLQYICEQENKNVSKQILELINEQSDGDMRKAINLLEQLFNLNQFTKDAVYQLTGRCRKEDAISFMQPQSFIQRYETCNEILEKGVSLQDFITEISKQVILSDDIKDERKIILIKHLAQIEENIVKMAPEQSQIAGLSSVFAL